MASNHFLDSLEIADRNALSPRLARVAFKTGECLVTPGDDVADVYLPINSIVSVITTMRDGSSIESRTIGRESGFGLLHALGSRYSYEHVEVQVSGDAFRLSTAALDAAAANSVSLRKAIVEHAQATLAQSAQTVACNALHGVRQRMCRWLLMTRDRLQSDIVPLTQEHLAIMLGVQRTTVTGVAASLQVEGMIRYSRGRIRLAEPDRIRQCACECYERVEKSVSIILP
jgi:CRP-like cAMP-binding protein